jgi:hypothetical protein
MPAKSHSKVPYPGTVASAAHVVFAVEVHLNTRHSKFPVVPSFVGSVVATEYAAPTDSDR